MPSFRLDQEPWIPVELKDGRQVELSLTDVFTHAPGIRRLTGNPLEVAVLMRLLLAIGHQVCNPTNDDQWIKAWNDRDSVVAKMAEYVQENAACFDLYDDVKPFAQHPKLLPSGKPLSKIQYDRAAGNNPIFLDGSSESDPVPLPSALAARALLVNLSFGGSHGKDFHPLRAGKEGSMLAGPLCARLIAIVEGETLSKSLLLNLTVAPRAGSPSWTRAILDQPGASETEGPSDLYTRLTRFVRLKPSVDGSFAESIALHMGDKVADDNEVPPEPMIPRYLSKDNKFKDLLLDKGKALWRSSGVLLCSRDSDRSRPIRALEQLAPQVGFGAIPRTEPVSLRILGVCGDAQGPKTFLWRDESLPFNLSLIADDASFSAIVRAVEVAESQGKALRAQLKGFAKRFLAQADPSVQDEKAWELVEELAPELYDYWSAIGPRGEQLASTPVDESEWALFVKKAADEAFRTAVDRLPPSARRFRAECANEIDDSPKRDKVKKDKTTV